MFGSLRRRRFRLDQLYGRIDLLQVERLASGPLSLPASAAQLPASFIISPQHADLYFHEIGFRWSQRIVTGQAVRKSRNGWERMKTLWSRVPPALQLLQVFRAATGRQMRRSPDGGIIVKSAVAVFG
ncbi:hypothetical protein ABIA14_005301 [Sinorhizobium fredii]